MTVCIASLAEKTVIGISDRMLTAGDMEFEPNQAKIWEFTNSIYALVAGDVTIQGRILKEVDIEVKSWFLSDPKTWIKVKDVAALYCQKYRDLRRERAEAEILHPVGLNLNSFLAQQSTMHIQEVERLAALLTEYDFDTIQEAIFIGIDTDGVQPKDGNPLAYPQIYATERDRLSWVNTVGFAAIGYGKVHAESQMMFYKHSQHRTFHDTLLLTYAAKKRAEAAPGVGTATDLIVIGPGLAAPFKALDKHVDMLDRIYQESRNTTLAGVARAQKKTKNLVDKIRKEYTEKAKTDAAKKQISPPSVSEKSKDPQ